MKNRSRHVLKSSDVRLEGQFRLDTDRNAAKTPDSATGSVQARASSAVTGVQVRVVENNAEFAVVEAICCCGAKTHIRCEYEDSKAIEQTHDQRNGGQDDNAN